MIKGGEIPGVVTDNCVIEGNIIFPTKKTILSIFKEIENILQKTIEEDESLKKYLPKLEMIDLRANPASIMSLSEGEDIVQTLKESVEEEGNCNFKIFTKPYASTIRFPINFDRTLAVGFGPKGDDFYKLNEWVSQEEYIKTIRILVNTTIKWCK